MQRIWLLPLRLGQTSILVPLTDPPARSTPTSPTICHPSRPPAARLRPTRTKRRPQPSDQEGSDPKGAFHR